MKPFLNSIQSEWIKTKRSAAFWLCIFGGFFAPIIQLIIYLNYPNEMKSEVFWLGHFNSLWRTMASFLLPMGIIMASSLITQLEFKNNTWKQLITTPQSLTQIFFAKFSVIILMTLQFFIYFNIGIFISGIIPSIIMHGGLPESKIPVKIFLEQNGLFFITCLPIIAIQYLISLQFKNFLVPFGIGFLLLVGTLIGGMWEHIYISPYSYCFLKIVPLPQNYNVHLYAFVYFIFIMIVSYFLFINKKEKG